MTVQALDIAAVKTETEQLGQLGTLLTAIACKGAGLAHAAESGDAAELMGLAPQTEALVARLARAKFSPQHRLRNYVKAFLCTAFPVRIH